MYIYIRQIGPPWFTLWNPLLTPTTRRDEEELSSALFKRIKTKNYDFIIL